MRPPLRPNDADQIIQAHYTRRRDAVFLPDQADRTVRGPLPDPLPAVDGNDEAADGAPLFFDQVDGLPHRGARGDDIVDHEDVLVFEGGADERAGFAVGFGFFAVEAVGGLGPLLRREGVQRQEGAGGEGNAFVGGSVDKDWGAGQRGERGDSRTYPKITSG